MFSLVVPAVLLFVVDFAPPRQTVRVSEVGKNYVSILLFVFCIVFLFFRLISLARARPAVTARLGTP